MSTKKLVALCLIVAVFASLLTVGTYAWLQDSDSDINVMTMGNVKIKQHEYERVLNADGTYEMVTSTRGEGYKLQPFTQNKPLLPAVGTATHWDSTMVWFDQLSNKANGGQNPLGGLTNVQDKFVLVENTGNVAAYVRTLIAYEMGDLTVEEFDKLIGVSYNQFWTWNDIGAIEINGNTYWLVEYVYEGSSVRHVGGIVPGGDFTYNSLAQVYMSQEATNEDVNAIDGNNSGTYDILVMSQAVQAQGFTDNVTALDAAFGDITVNNHPWSQTAKSKLQAAIDAAPKGGEVFAWQITDENIIIREDDVVAVELDGYTINGRVANYGYVTMKNGTIDVSASGFQNFGGVAQLENMTILAGDNANYSNITHSGGLTVYNNVAINSAGGGVGVNNGAEVVFNGGSIAVNSSSTSGRYVFYVVGEGSTVTINGGEFSFSKTLNQKRAYVYTGAGATVYINGGNFGVAPNHKQYTPIMGDGTVIITGGTFGFDPSEWVAEGYEAVKDNGVWTVTAK